MVSRSSMEKDPQHVELGVTARDTSVSALAGTWLVEDLLFQGPRPPKGEQWNPGDWIEIPHHQFIPISLARFKQTLLHSPEAQQHGPELQEFVRMLGMLFHIQHYNVLLELKEDYEYFSASTGEDARKDVPEEELLWRERRFLGNFLKTMVCGNFYPFQEDDYQQAMKHDYLFDLPVELRWESYDQRLFENFFQVSVEEEQALMSRLGLEGTIHEYLRSPDSFRGRIWTFYRGIGMEQTEGLFLPAKADRMLSDVVRWIILPFQWIVEKVRGESSERPQNSLRVIKKVLFGEQKEEEQPRPSVGESSHSFQKRWMRRLNLHNQPNAVKDFLKPRSLQEPTFHRMISLFRMRPPVPAEGLRKIPGLGALLERFMPAPNTEERDWTIYIKLFHEIPMADSEMIFPARKLRMKSLDVTVLVMTALAGLFALYRGLQSARSTLLLVLFSVLGLYVVKLILGYRRVRARYLARVTETLYHKNLDNDMGVLEYLVSSMEEQDLKESVLVYFLLWRIQRALSLEELDAQVEHYIQEHFQGIEVDFEVTDALRKVLDSGEATPRDVVPLVQSFQSEDGQFYYQAKPLDEAIELLKTRWDNLHNPGTEAFTGL